MNRLALDIGTKRIGVCLYIENISLPQRFVYIDEIDKYLINIINEYSIEEIIIGLPLNRQGEETDMSKWIRDFIKNKEVFKKINTVYYNEFLSSKEAERKIKNDIGKKKYKEKVDSMSACIILENYLNEKKKEK